MQRWQQSRRERKRAILHHMAMDLTIVDDREIPYAIIKSTTRTQIIIINFSLSKMLGLAEVSFTPLLYFYFFHTYIYAVIEYPHSNFSGVNHANF